MIELIVLTLKQMSFVPKVLLYMFLGLAMADLLIRYNVMNKLAFLGKPLVRLCKLPKETGLALLAGIGATVAANTALVALYRQKIVNRKQLVIAAILNSVPTYIRQVFSRHIPVLIPLVGWQIGAVYLVCYLLAAAMKVAYCFIKSRLPSFDNPEKERETEDIFNCEQKIGHGNKESFLRRKIRGLLDFIKMPDLTIRIPRFGKFTILTVDTIILFISLALNMAAIMFVALFIINTGCLTIIFQFILPFLKAIDLPVEIAVLLPTFLTGDITVSAGILGAFVRQGIVNNAQAVATLVLGALIGLPIFTLRHVLPNYIGIFGLRIGGKIVAIAFTIVLFTRIITLIFIIAFLI